MASESVSSIKPFFNGTDYPNWKIRMELYLDSDLIDIWDSVIKEWKAPTTTTNGVTSVKE